MSTFWRAFRDTLRFLMLPTLCLCNMMFAILTPSAALNALAMLACGICFALCARRGDYDQTVAELKLSFSEALRGKRS